MSDELDHDPISPDDGDPTITDAARSSDVDGYGSGEGLASHMAQHPRGASRAGQGTRPDLEASARAAAEDAIAKAELALAAAQVAATGIPAATAPAEKGAGDRTWILQGVLLLNLVLMGVMLALPNPPASDPIPDVSSADPAPVVLGGPAAAEGTAGQTDAVTGEDGPTAQPDAVEPTAAPLFPPISSEAWIQALQAAGRGDFERAAHALEGYLELNPNLPTFERRMYYGALVNYLREAGREADAEHYLGKQMALVSQSYLPADILRMARDAEDKGEGARMRQLLARFLLTQKKHTAAERRAVAEAYLKLGDSYRIQAERGEARAAVMQRMRESRLRMETRERRARSAGDASDKGGK